MSRSSTVSVSEENGFPRVSGDEPAYQMYVGGQNSFSPRERG